jgi:hypothetical protein
MLCDLGADFDLSDNDGNTPLHQYVLNAFKYEVLMTLRSSASAWGHIPVRDTINISPGMRCRRSTVT